MREENERRTKGERERGKEKDEDEEEGKKTYYSYGECNAITENNFCEYNTRYITACITGKYFLEYNM